MFKKIKTSETKIDLKIVFLFLLSVLASAQLLAQPANNDCSGAILITPGTCCNFTTYTNAGATASAGVPNPTCGNYVGADVWFKVVVPASGHLIFNAETSNSGSDASMSIYSGTCGALTEIECDANSGYNGLNPLIDNPSLTPGSTVYVRYWLAGNASGESFDLCIYSPPIQGPCTNLGFENGITGWTGTIGNSSTGPAGAPRPYYIPEVYCPGIGSDPNFTLVTGGTDPYGGFPQVYSGTTSMKIGDDGTYETYNAASVEQTFMVDSTNTKFTFHYAAVLQDGGHDDNEQPFFECDLIDQFGNILQCAFYQVTVPFPGFVLSGSGSSIYYKPWTEVNMNLTNYIGQYITTRFTVSDCDHVNQGAHFGYAYLDCACSPYGIIAPDTICLGQSVTISAPTGADAYLWSNGATTPTITITPTADTTFYCTVTETAITSCSSVLEAHIFVRPFIPPTSGSNSPICAGQTVNLTSTPSGALSYNWTGPNGFSSNLQNPSITNATPAASGVYTVTVIKGGCTGTSTVTVTVNPIDPVMASNNGPLCSGATLNLTATPNSGTAYNWSGPNGFTSNLQNPSITNATPAASGVYTVTVTYTGGCTTAVTTTVLVNASLVINASTTSNVTCYGHSDGTASAVPTNGISPYNYNWSTMPVQNTQNASNLSPGTYSVTVTDNAGCSATGSVNITQPTAISASITSVNDVLCFGALTGSASAGCSGGTPSYTYNWSGGTPSGGSVTGLGFGNYTVTVSDAHSCDTVLNFSINQQPQLVLVLTGVDETCSNSCDGSITAAVSGGNDPYQYHWSIAGSITNVLNNLCAGNYSLTVTDSNNCTINEQITISTTTILNASALVDSINSVVNQPVYFYGSNAWAWVWDFGDGSATSSLQNPIHTYNTDGTYTVTLTIYSPDSCKSEAILVITIFIPSTIFIPNIVTPNGDGFNDVFRVDSKGLGSELMLIYNRWGKKVFSWDNVGGSWDGTDGNRQYADGTYYFIYTAKGAGDGKSYDVHGTVTVLK